HVGHNVVAVYFYRLLGLVAEGGMQNGAPLGGVDFGTGEHIVAQLIDAGGAGQVKQELERFGGETVFGEIGVNIASFEAKFVGPAGIGGKQLAQVNVFYSLVMV